jgi:hypothetical protein
LSESDLAGYRGSRPVHVGNVAAGQTQLDIYGVLFETAWLYSEGHHALDQDTGAVLGRIADHVCRIWREPDSGIWEVRNGPFHFTHSKVMCCAALKRTARLGGRAGCQPGAQPRRREAEAIGRLSRRRLVLASQTPASPQRRCRCELLMLPIVGYGIAAAQHSRHHRRGQPPASAWGFVYRYHADDGVLARRVLPELLVLLASALARCDA